MRRLAAVKRTALPVRLVAAFNKVKIKGIAKKILLNNTFVTSRRLSGEAHGASGGRVIREGPLYFAVFSSMSFSLCFASLICSIICPILPSPAYLDISKKL